MIELTCQCGKAFKVKDELAGKRGRCPVCGTVMQVPDAPVFIPIQAPARPTPKPAKVSNATVFKWMAVASVLGFGFIMTFVAWVNYEARKYAQSVSNSQAILIREMADRDDAAKVELAKMNATIQQVIDAQKQVEAAERESERRWNEGVGREPSTPEELAEQRRLAKEVEDSFGNDLRGPHPPLEIVDSLIMPGDGNWLFLSSGEWTDNVTAVENSVVLSGSDRRRTMCEGEFVWAKSGIKAATRFYAYKQLKNPNIEIESLETEEFGNIWAIVREKANGQKWELHVNRFWDVWSKPIRD